MANNSSAISSVMEALTLKNIVIRLGIFFGFAIIIALRHLVLFLNQAGQGAFSNNAFINYAKAIYLAFQKGLVISLGSIWEVVTNSDSYIAANGWGSIIISILLFIAVLLWFYNIVSFGFDLAIKDKEESQFSIFMAKIGLTVGIVLLLSAFVFFLGDGETLSRDDSILGNQTLINDSIEQGGEVEINDSELAKNSTAVINLLLQDE